MGFRTQQACQQLALAGTACKSKTASSTNSVYSCMYDRSDAPPASKFDSGIAADNVHVYNCRLLVVENGRFQLVHCHGSAYELREPLAGNGQQGAGLTDSEATAGSGKSVLPRFVVCGSSQIVYFSDANCVRRFMPATREIRTLAGIPAKIPPADACNSDTSAKFNSPWGLALDEDAGLLYVADSCNHCIKRVNISTGEVSILVPGGSGLKFPIGLVSITRGSFFDLCLQPYLIGRKAALQALDISLSLAVTNPNHQHLTASFVSGWLVGWQALHRDCESLYCSDEGGIKRIEVVTGTVTAFAGALSHLTLSDQHLVRQFPTSGLVARVQVMVLVACRMDLPCLPDSTGHAAL